MSSLAAKAVKPLALAALAAAILFCASCSMNDGRGGVSGEINSPVEFKYLTENNLKINTVTVESSERINRSYIQIEGLADEEVQKKINDKLKTLYEEMTVDQVPPYRGVKAIHPNPGRVYTENLMMNATANFNNILSVSAYQSRNRTLLDGNLDDKNIKFYNHSWYSDEEKTLNFDLNTGKEIKLSDVFCDDTEYMNKINGYVSDLLMRTNADDEGSFSGEMEMGGGGLKLVSPFHGLSENQKFGLYDMGISLIFDYETPQFETIFAPVSIMIPYDKLAPDIAITERFYEDKSNLYKDNKTSIKQFVQGSEVKDISKEDYSENGDVTIIRNMRSSSTYPKFIQDEGARLYEVNKNLADALAASVSEAKMQEGAEDVYACYEMSVNIFSLGDYITISSYQSPYLSTGKEFDMISVYKTYDMRTKKKMEAGDIFKKGFDYRGAFNASAQKEQKIIYDEITSMGIFEDGIQISSKGSLDGQEKTSSCFIPYRDIGCENLKIF